MSTIFNTIEVFYKDLSRDKNHRYRSWEHCFSYFKKNKKDIDIEVACLHLSFYLASWGMYRGSSPLLWKDYLIHKPVVKKIISVYKDLQNFSYTIKEINNIFILKKYIKEYYKSTISVIKNKNGIYYPSDVLITKIILGTLGCVPAYDRYFVDGMRENNIKPLNFSKKNLNKLIDFYKKEKNYSNFNKVQKNIKNKSKIDYPIMKLIDMYFWQTGFENDKNKK